MVLDPIPQSLPVHFLVLDPSPPPLHTTHSHVCVWICIARWWHDSFRSDACSVLQCVAVCVAVCCSVLQCVAVCCSVTWLIQIRSFTCQTWLIHTWVSTHLDVRHDSFTCESWRIQMRDMTHSNVWNDTFTWAMTHPLSFTPSYSHVRHDSFRTGANSEDETFEWFW